MMTIDSWQVAPKLTELALKAFGKLDGIIVNHGVLSPMTRIADSDIAAWKKLYDANLFSALALVKMHPYAKQEIPDANRDR